MRRRKGRGKDGGTKEWSLRKGGKSRMNIKEVEERKEIENR